MFAEVIPQIRTIPSLGIFDYEIPDNLKIKRGDLVKIDFRHSEKSAIVYRLKQQSFYKNVKPIISKIEGLTLGSQQMAIIDWLSKKFQISPALALKTILPKIPKKSCLPKEKKELASSVVKQKINKNRIAVLKNIIAQISRIKQPVILHYNKINEKNAFLLGMAKTLKKNQQLLIIVPEKRDLDLIAPLFKIEKPVIIHSGLNNNQRWQIWLAIKNNQAKIIIGTKTAIFIPPENLGLIIIDNEEDRSHYNYDQNPKYDVLSVAEQLNTKIILTSQAPSIVNGFKYQVIEFLNRTNPVEIIDMDLEKEKGNYSYFSEKLLFLMAQRKKSLLLFNRKGEAKWLVCKNCQEILPYENTTFCSNCKSLDLKKISFGTAKLKNDLISLFPNKKIIEITKNEKTLKTDYDIIIGTEYALRVLNINEINLIAVISADHQLAMPDYQAAEKVWQFIVKAANLGKETILQTKSPENKIIKSVANQDYPSFKNHELGVRKKYHYPPFDRE